jgi:hypothetical protein
MDPYILPSKIASSEAVSDIYSLRFLTVDVAYVQTYTNQHQQFKIGGVVYMVRVLISVIYICYTHIYMGERAGDKSI